MYPTPYPDVNTILHALLLEAQTILGPRFVGMYLYGSLASGDFDPQRSDVDFVIVTDGALPTDTIAALAAMHARLAASGLKWARKLEGTYIPKHALRRYDPDAAPYPCLNEGKFYIAQHGSDWIIQRHILREYGAVVAGPALHMLIDPVLPDDLRRATQGILQEWWLPMLHDPTRLHDDEYRAYAVLTMCRALHTLQHGCIVSKPVAARWAQETLGERWSALIARSLAWRPDAPPDGISATETLAFIRYMLERSQHTGV